MCILLILRRDFFVLTAIASRNDKKRCHFQVVLAAFVFNNNYPLRLAQLLRDENAFSNETSHKQLNDMVSAIRSDLNLLHTLY